MLSRKLVVILALAVLGAGLASCGKNKRRTMPEPPSNGDEVARNRFYDARTRFEREDVRENVNMIDEFQAIAREYPGDPIVPWAHFYAARSAFRAEAYGEAETILKQLSVAKGVEPALQDHVRFYLGLTAGYQGRHNEALTLLQTDVAVDDTEAGERFAVMAASSAALGRTGEALVYYEEWFRIARMSERMFVVARAQALIDALPVQTVEAAYKAVPDRGGPMAALLAERLAEEAVKLGNVELATELRDDTSSARQLVGLALPEETSLGSGEEGNPNLVGAALPLTGRRTRPGLAAMRGIGLAAGTFDEDAGRGVDTFEPRTARGGVPVPFDIALRDSASQSRAASLAVDRLASQGAVAVIGPMGVKAVEDASRAAARYGMPLLALDATGGGEIAPVEGTFHVVVSPVARARGLARHAIEQGRQRFAVLAPDIDYGRTTALAFIAEVEALGGEVIVQQNYSSRTTSFTSIMEDIAGKPWDTIFVPDTARRLELVAAALTAANLYVRPAGTTEVENGRPIMLLSTAEALSPRYLRGSGRYSLGAVFAPGFYPDPDDPRTAAFRARYEAAFNDQPTYLDAYAYDAAIAVRYAVESGASNRAEVRSAIAGSKIPGLTGTLEFDGLGRRSDSGLLYVVEQERGGRFRIRAQR